MAYVHCHNCDWSQDDFWSEGYNPIRSLRDWEENLLDFDRLDEQFTTSPGFIREHGPITLREVIARECEKAAERIRSMVFLREDPNYRKKPCPKCGELELDVD